MDRDRDSRERDARRPRGPFVDQYGTGGGQSYRPGGARERSPPPPLPRSGTDSYRARSPPPRRAEPPFVDSYRGGGGAPRPRSRSPPPRREEYRRRSPSPPRYRDDRAPGGRVDSYRGGRPRSPLPQRREELPRDDLFRREPVREQRDVRDTRADYRDDRERVYAAPRSPPRQQYRDRSPVPLKRGREPSPMVGSRGRRTPPPAAKRERQASPLPAARGRFDDYPPSRAASPPRQRQYSPDPRDRRQSPPRGNTREYRPRSRSPPVRNDRVDPRTVDDWRKPPRSPSPQPRYASRQDHIAMDTGRESTATSRRSSPPVHPSRMALQPTQSEERGAPTRPPARDPYNDNRNDRDDREPYRAPPEPRRAPSPAPRERAPYADDRADHRVPPPREERRIEDAPRAPPAGPAGYRAPPTAAAMAPPNGPAAVVPISAHARAPAAPPSGPRAAIGSTPRGDFGMGRGRGAFDGGRGGFAGSRGGFDGGRGGFDGFRGGRGGAAPGFPRGGAGFGRGDGFGRGGGEGAGRGEGFGRGAPPGTNDYNAGAAPGPPSGPRGSFSNNATPHQGPPGFRPSSNETATTYPRTQRFAPNGAPIPSGPAQQQQQIQPSAGGTPTGPRNLPVRRPTEPIVPSRPAGPHPALASLPQIIPGGLKAEPLVDQARLTKLTEESERLRKIIEQKEQKKRKLLRDWDRLGREVEVAAVRSEVAEEGLRRGEGEGRESASAF